MVAVAAIAAVDQATNHFSGYGQGAQGYAILGTSIREAAPSVPDSCMLSLVPSFVRGTINAGSRATPPSSASSLPALSRIYIYLKETVTELG
jgi:hypothetical protein